MCFIGFERRDTETQRMIFLPVGTRHGVSVFIRTGVGTRRAVSAKHTILHPT